MKGTADVWRQAIEVLCECANNHKPDVAAPAAKRLLNQRPEGMNVPSSAVKAFADILNRIGTATMKAAA